MRFWIQAILEEDDEPKQCYKCRVWFSPPENIFAEFDLVSGGMPHPDELHPDTTGSFMCSNCAKMTLI
jgi:hypothetical protein